jgi:hypothetical protein
MSLVDRIRTAVDRQSRPLVVPQWRVVEEDAAVLLSLTARQRQVLEGMFRKDTHGNVTNSAAIPARAIVLSAHDADGKPIFGEADVAWLQDKSGQVIADLFKVIADISGMSAEGVKDAEKNSQSTAA